MAEKYRCPKCDGKGRWSSGTYCTNYGPSSSWIECYVCGGTGAVYKYDSNCERCGGSGQDPVAGTCEDCCGCGWKLGKTDSSSKGCYITTAVCKELNLEDSEKVLNEFRGFRDKWLISTEKGNELISEYYDSAPMMLKEISLRGDCDILYKIIWDKFLYKALINIQTNNNRDALNLYIDMIYWLKKELYE